MDAEDPVSKARIFRAPASEPGVGAPRNASRISDASCRSRQILQATRANVSANFFRNAVKAAVFSKVPVDLSVPRGVISLANKSGQFGEFFGRKGFYSALYFGEAHIASVTAITSRNNYSALRNSVGVTPTTRRKTCANALGLAGRK
jgi:hypothetical protein